MMDAQTLTIALHGRWHGRYGAAPCPVCQLEARKGQDALTLTDSATGSLLLHCKKGGCGYRDILSAAGISTAGVTQSGFTDPEVRRIRELARKLESANRARQAKRVWNEAQPIGGTLAEIYLRRRGITCDFPDTLRFHPSCFHATAQRFPALVAKVEGAEAFALHRTYLRADGSGKADVTPTKAMLGGTQGGAVRLATGPGPLVVAEGIETALSLASGLLRAPAAVWAALSTSGIRGLHLPDKPGCLTIAADGDKPGRDAAHALATRAHGLGWQVAFLTPPDGSDWNDILTGEGDAA